MAKYNNYKDTGIPWIGQIPLEWEVKRNKNVFSCNKNIVGSESSSTQLLSLTTNGIRKKNIDETGGKIPESYDTYQHVKANDIVMCLFDLDCSAVFSGLSKYDGMISPAYKILRCNESIMPGFADYWFRSVFVGRKFKYLAKNIRYSLTYEDFSALEIPCPTLIEQKAIVDYLDRVCSNVDSIIAEAQASIEEYKAWKASIIYEAVTKGLDPNVEMKDSGVDIIGNMPDHWTVCRLKYLCNVMTGNQDTQNADENGMYPFYVRSPIVQHSNTYTYDGEGILMAGDGAGAGRVFHHAFGKYAIHQRVYCFHDFKNINTRYFLYFISELFKKVMDKGSAQSTVPSVRLPMIQDFVFCMPDAKEQADIVRYLDAKCNKIDEIISEKEVLIADLESYKKSLIFEVVTGKRKVV